MVVWKQQTIGDISLNLFKIKFLFKFILSEAHHSHY
jgi:hypothetical protein